MRAFVARGRATSHHRHRHRRCASLGTLISEKAEAEYRTALVYCNDRSVFLSVQKIYALPHEDSNEYSDSQYRFRQWWQWKYMQAVKGDQRVKIVQEHKGDISM